MKKTTVVQLSLMAALLLLAACSPAAQTNENCFTKQISVTGSGVVYVAPDVAYVNVGVHSQGDTVSEALDDNNKQAAEIKKTLVAQGVAEGDIQTSSFNVYPQSDYNNQGTATRTYYSVDNSVYVTVRDLDTISTILDTVATSGANSIYGINFDVLDKTAAQTSARKIAMDSAKAQAQELADAAGVKLGDILSISSSYSYPSTASGYGIGGGGSDAAYSSVPVTAGQIQVSADVSISYGIK